MTQNIFATVSLSMLLLMIPGFEIPYMYIYIYVYAASALTVATMSVHPIIHISNG